MPKVSIITASYNYEHYIKETIKSVINQTYSDWEMIIVDDGSIDNSIDVIKEYAEKDNRIKLYTHDNNQNKGLAETLKLGISKTTGDYIVFLESDDYVRKDYLEKKIEFLEKNESIGVVINYIELFGNEKAKDRIKKYMCDVEQYWGKNHKPHNAGYILHYFNVVPTFSCVMAKADLLKECSYASPKQAWLDWWLWAQLSSKTEFYCYPEKLTYWRMHEQSYICRDENDINSMKEVNNFYHKIYDVLPPINGINNKIKIFCKKICREIKYNFSIKIKERKAFAL